MRYAIRTPVLEDTRLHDQDVQDFIRAVLIRTEVEHRVVLVKYTAEIARPPDGPYLVVVGYAE